MQSYLSRAVGYFREVRQELKKVNWPSRQDTLQHTAIVIAASLVVAIFLGGLDALFTLMLDKFVL